MSSNERHTLKLTIYLVEYINYPVGRIKVIKDQIWKISNMISHEVNFTSELYWTLYNFFKLDNFSQKHDLHTFHAMKPGFLLQKIAASETVSPEFFIKSSHCTHPAIQQLRGLVLYLGMVLSELLSNYVYTSTFQLEQ